MSPEQQLADFLLNLEPNLDGRIKSRHKKSLSDNFNISHDQMASDQKKYYEMFANLKDPEEFFKKISPSSKSRFANTFQNKEDIGKGKNMSLDYFSNNLALQNYNITPSNTSSLNASFTKINVEEKNQTKSNFFNEGEINYMENLQTRINKAQFYATPPGLTPKKEELNKSNEMNAELGKPKEEIFQKNNLVFL